jgi:hypothetical protein
MRPLIIRERRDEDLAELARLLAEQQPGSRYPVRWPPPVPVEGFLVRPTEERAWVAELDGHVVGHVSVCRVGGRPPGSVRCHDGHRGSRRAGRTLCRRRRRRHRRLPVLTVAPTHERPLEVDGRRGWRVVGETGPPWLRDDEPPLVPMVLDQD